MNAGQQQHTTTNVCNLNAFSKLYSFYNVSKKCRQIKQWQCTYFWPRVRKREPLRTNERKDNFVHQNTWGILFVHQICIFRFSGKCFWDVFVYSLTDLRFVGSEVGLVVLWSPLLTQVINSDTLIQTFPYPFLLSHNKHYKYAREFS